jgi:hypothetical protein
MPSSKEIKSPNGLHRVEIKSNAMNLWSFEEETYDTDGDGYTYWHVVRISGLYDSAEAAERSARLEIAWLRDQTSD